MSDKHNLKKVKALCMDVDGVLTDGRIILGDDGAELRGYFVRDGLGMQLCRRAGIRLAFITSSPSKGILERGKRLGVDHVSLGVKDKATELKRQSALMGIDPSEVAFIGDDLVDIPAMKLAGLSIAVADATPAVRDCADMVTENPGGRGAVREVCEMLVEAQDPGFFKEAKKCGFTL